MNLLGDSFTELFSLDGTFEGLLDADGDVDCCCEPVAPGCNTCPYGTPQMGPPSDPVVDTVYARITNVTGCDCLDGLCVPLLWFGESLVDGGTWQGTIAIPGCPQSHLTLNLGCCGDNGWYLGSDDCLAGGTPDRGKPCPPQPLQPIATIIAVEPGWTCRPYVMSFKNMPGLTCCGGGNALFDVEITETPC